jgi:hypothetical protein
VDAIIGESGAAGQPVWNVFTAKDARDARENQ